MPGISKNL